MLSFASHKNVGGLLFVHTEKFRFSFNDFMHCLTKNSFYFIFILQDFARTFVKIAFVEKFPISQNTCCSSLSM